MNLIVLTSHFLLTKKTTPLFGCQWRNLYIADQSGGANQETDYNNFFLNIWYLDDSLLKCKKEEAIQILDHLNGIEPNSIKFTKEE